MAKSKRTRYTFVAFVVAFVIVAGLAPIAAVLLRYGRGVPVGTLAGRVVDENSSPVRSARVYVYSSSGTNEVRTNWLGNFRLENVPASGEFAVMVSYLEYGHIRFAGVRSGQWRRFQILPHGYELYGRPAPPLCIEKWYNTNSLSLPNLHGQVVLLHIGLHIDDYDRYNRMVLQTYARYGGQGFVVVGIHAPPSGTWRRPVTDGEVMAYLNQRGISFPVGLDQRDPGGTGATYGVYRANASPAKYLIDKKGVLRCSPRDENLEQWVKRLLAE